MAIIYSDAYYKQAVTNDVAGGIIAVRAEAAAPATLAANDVMEMVRLPAGYIITGGYLAATDLDTNATPTITMTVGLMDIADTTLDSDTDLLTASTVGQGGALARFDTGLTQGPFAVDKIVAIKVANVAATKASGTVTCQVEYAQP